MNDLDGKLVFIWDDSTTDQNVDGELVFIEEDEVELVGE